MPQLRSLLGVLGTDLGGLEASVASAADAVVVDLEDGVAAAEKPAAREIAAAFAAREGDRLAVYVRINGCESEHFAEDVATVVRKGLTGVQFPKAESASDIEQLDRLLGGAEAVAGMVAGSTRVIPTLESAHAIRNAFAIAAASRRIVGLMPAIGENGDLQQDLGYRSTADEVGSLYARSQIVLATRAAGAAAAIDGVWMDVDDEDGLVRSAHLARTLGYRAKKVAAPSQVEAINRIFAR